MQISDGKSSSFDLIVEVDADPRERGRVPNRGILGLSLSHNAIDVRGYMNDANAVYTFELQLLVSEVENPDFALCSIDRDLNIANAIFVNGSFATLTNKTLPLHVADIIIAAVRRLVEQSAAA